MMPAIGVDEKISQILSGLLIYREPDDEDIRCAIDGILRLIKEEREACAKIADSELEARKDCLKAADERGDQQSYSGHWYGITASETIAKEIRARGDE